MRRAASLGLVGVVFATGLLAGLLGGRLLGIGNRGSSDRFDAPPFQRYFSRGGLDLTVDQQERIEEIFRRQRGKFEALHRDLRPEVEALMDETQEEIEAILTPEQLERYRSRRDRWRGRMEHRDPLRRGPRRRFPPRDPPPPEDPPPGD